jgi:hypothetical protein
MNGVPDVSRTESVDHRFRMFLKTTWELPGYAGYPFIHEETLGET